MHPGRRDGGRQASGLQLVDQVLARQLLLPLAFDRGQRLSENLRRRRPEAATPLAVKVHRRAVQA